MKLLKLRPNFTLREMVSLMVKHKVVLDLKKAPTMDLEQFCLDLVKKDS